MMAVAAIGSAQASQWLPALLSRLTGETSQQPVTAVPAGNGPAANSTPVQLATNGRYRDGSFAGPAYDTYYGPVQVQVNIRDGLLDPCGIVKGWAIRNAARLIGRSGARHFFVDAGGDIQTGGQNADGEDWKIGIRNPFNEREIIKAVTPKGRGIATSGTYVRGQHIYDPRQPGRRIDDIVSLTVIGPDVLEADRFSTAAFAMGKAGIYFIEQLAGFEGYEVDAGGIATQTSGFGAFVTP